MEEEAKPRWSEGASGGSTWGGLLACGGVKPVRVQPFHLRPQQRGGLTAEVVVEERERVVGHPLRVTSLDAVGRRLAQRDQVGPAEVRLVAEDEVILRASQRGIDGVQEGGDAQVQRAAL